MSAPNDDGAGTGTALRVQPGVDARQVRPPRPPQKRRVYTTDEFVSGVLACDRVVLGRAFTLLESARQSDRDQAEELLRRVMPHSGGAVRLAVSGAPGVGKSSFIERLGLHLIETGRRVAVLAIDPSSEISGGSVLGDKTRMLELARSPHALVRPSPSGRHRGGVARRTRELIFLAEAAGFDVVIVETIGVGQSETQAASMVDTFLLLLMPGAGDELQGVKRGVMELVDLVAINKADGDNEQPAELARAQFEQALRMLRPSRDGWRPRVLTCSALTGRGVGAVWQAALDHRAFLDPEGRLAARRRRQDASWFREAVEALLWERIERRSERDLTALEAQVVAGELSAAAAARLAVDAVLPPDEAT